MPRANTPAKSFGATIRRRRQQLGLDKATLAKILGVNLSHICCLENNTRGPSLALLARLADVLQLDCGQLLLYAHPEAERLVILLCQSKARNPEPDQAWQDFKRNKTILECYNVSDDELAILEQVSRLGQVSTPRGFVAVLSTIRQVLDDDR